MNMRTGWWLRSHGARRLQNTARTSTPAAATISSSGHDPASGDLKRRASPARVFASRPRQPHAQPDGAQPGPSPGFRAVRGAVPATRFGLIGGSRAAHESRPLERSQTATHPAGTVHAPATGEVGTSSRPRQRPGPAPAAASLTQARSRDC